MGGRVDGILRKGHRQAMALGHRLEEFQKDHWKNCLSHGRKTGHFISKQKHESFE